MPIRTSPTEGRIVGTPGQPRTVTLADLPADHDLRHNFWRHVILDGLDLSAYDMRDMDILDYSAVGTAFGQMDWAILRRGDATGAIIPSDISSFSQLVVEVLRAAPNISHPAVTLVYDHVRSDERFSWNDSIHRLRTELGMADADTLATFNTAFIGFPGLLGRLAEMVQTQPRSDPPGTGITVATPVRVLGRSGEHREQFAAQLAGQHDRFAAGRLIELVFQARGEDMAVHIDQLTPWPNVQIVERTIMADQDFGWWRTGWPA